MNNKSVVEISSDGECGNVPAQSSTPKAEDICQSCKHAQAMSSHTCPFAEEIHDDGDSLCNCCDDCAYECAMDI